MKIYNITGAKQTGKTTKAFEIIKNTNQLLDFLETYNKYSKVESYAITKNTIISFSRWDADYNEDIYEEFENNYNNFGIYKIPNVNKIKLEVV